MNLDIVRCIKWYISYEPSVESVVWREREKRKKAVPADLFETNVFGEGTYKLSFPMNDDYSYFVEREVKGPLSLGALLRFIYNFYQTPVTPEDFEASLKDADAEWKEEMEEMYEENAGLVRNIHLMSDDPSPDLVEIAWDEESKAYIVHLGPE